MLQGQASSHSSSAQSRVSPLHCVLDCRYNDNCIPKWTWRNRTSTLPIHMGIASMIHTTLSEEVISLPSSSLPPSLPPKTQRRKDRLFPSPLPQRTSAQHRGRGAGARCPYSAGPTTQTCGLIASRLTASPPPEGQVCCTPCERRGVVATTNSTGHHISFGILYLVGSK